MKYIKKIVLSMVVLCLLSTTAVYAANVKVPTSSLVSALNGSLNKNNNRVQFGNVGAIYPTTTTVASLCNKFDLPYSHVGGTKIVVSAKHAQIYNDISGATFSLIVGASTAGIGTYEGLALGAVSSTSYAPVKVPQLTNGTYYVDFYTVTAPQSFLLWKYTTDYTIEVISSPSGVSVSEFTML